MPLWCCDSKRISLAPVNWVGGEKKYNSSKAVLYQHRPTVYWTSDEGITEGLMECQPPVPDQQGSRRQSQTWGTKRLKPRLDTCIPDTRGQRPTWEYTSTAKSSGNGGWKRAILLSHSLPIVENDCWGVTDGCLSFASVAQETIIE